MYHNIEKSAFKPGAYVGYGGGTTWRIAKWTLSRSTFEWIAAPINGNTHRDAIRAPRLCDMSAKLAALPTGGAK